MSLDSLKPFIAWLHFHPHWGGFFAFLFAFLESIAIIGLVVPGSAIMTAIGLLVGAGVLPITATLIWAIAGAFAGDIISYWFGCHYRDSIRDLWPFNKFPAWLDKGESFFISHGGKSIFIGRFLGPIRPILPVIAGMLKMPPKRFFPIDFIAAACWAPVYMLPGFILGAASLALPPEAATRIIIYLVVALFLIWILFWLIKKILTKIIKMIDRSIYHLWQYLQKKRRLSPLTKLLQATHIPDDHTQLGIAFFLLLSVVLFIIVAFNAATYTGIISINEPIHIFFRSLYNPITQKIMLMLTFLGKPANLVVLWAVVLIYLLFRRNWFAAIHWLLLGLFAIGSIGVLKRFMDFPRPLGIHLPPTSGSFPSGHTTMSTTIYGFLALLLSKDKSKYLRWFIYICTALLILAIAFSRIYLGAHWPVDVIGGILLGLSLILVIALFFRRHPSPKIPARQLLSVALITVLVTWSYTMLFFYQRDIQNFTPTWVIKTISFKTWWQQGIDNKPIFRNNRFGKPIQTLNIEWSGSLQHIEKNLTKQGWTLKPKSRLMNTINYIGSKNRSKTLPILTSVYQCKKPVLVMSKLVGPDHRLLILRLWNSHFIFSENKKSLWAGSLIFRRLPRFHFILHLTDKKLTPPEDYRSVLNILIPDLKAYDWKKIHYANYQPLNQKQDFDWHGDVLLIKEKVKQ